MSQVLYRKYRSKNFSEVVGQDHITSILRQAVKKESVSHSYLFNGPRGTGKTSMARILAKALNCKSQKDGEPCDECSICEAISKSNFLDLMEIDAASNRGIDQIRDLRDRVNFSPVEGKYKIYIIDEVHMLTKEAFNALLKTLEEPPEYAVFILATTEIHKVPDTIISRCQRFDFKLGSPRLISQKLNDICKSENMDITEGALDLIAIKAKGSYRDAETILEKVISEDEQRDGEIDEDEVRIKLGYIETELMDAFMDAITIHSIAGAVGVIEDMYLDGKDLNQFITQVIEICRQGINNNLKNEPDRYKLSLSQYSLLIKGLNQSRLEAKDAVLPQLPIEIAIIDFIENSGGRVSQSSGINIPNIVKDMASAVTGRKPEKPELNPIAKKKPQGDVNISDKEITKHWKELINEVKPFNHNLSAFLMLARFKKIDGDEVILEVPYMFHKKKIEQKRSREILTGIGNKMWGADLIFNCEVNKEIAEERREKEGDMVDTVKEVFGDILIEE